MAEVWSGRPAPGQKLRALWHDLCFNQFHDTLAGSAIKEASDEAIMALGRTITGAREIGDDAARGIAARVDTSNRHDSTAPAGTVVLFNPSGDGVSQYAEYEPWTAWQPWRTGGWNLYDDNDRLVPCQVVETHEALSSAQFGVSRILFRAELPPMGYRVYRFRQDEAHTGRRRAPRTNRPRSARRRQPAWKTTCWPCVWTRPVATSSRASTGAVGWKWRVPAAGMWPR